jgi:hypothetical protein
LFVVVSDVAGAVILVAVTLVDKLDGLGSGRGLHSLAGVLRLDRFARHFGFSLGSFLAIVLKRQKVVSGLGDAGTMPSIVIKFCGADLRRFARVTTAPVLVFLSVLIHHGMTFFIVNI